MWRLWSFAVGLVVEMKQAEKMPLIPQGGGYLPCGKAYGTYGGSIRLKKEPVPENFTLFALICKERRWHGGPREIEPTPPDLRLKT